jgi:epoxyqueuosine reductase
VKEALIAYARQLGFELCGIAPAGPAPHAPEFLDWLKAGNAGEMAWLERAPERRSDPRTVLPEAKSVIVLAMNYWQGAPPPSGKECLDRVARYAWGDDYHEHIERKLKLLDSFLSAQGGTQKCYVDTGPVLERDFAALAGVGWQGKSTMIINPRLGTWFFLAAILTTLPIPPDPPHPDRCGQCTRCISACPTRAITAPRQLDARRCISYLTIELKGSIPEELRPLIGPRVYGCDECLSACPWNRFAQQSRVAEFQAREGLRHYRLRDFLSLSDDQFRELFRKSPIKRVKRRGFLRNVCVALGNTGTPEDLPALRLAARDPEELIVEHANWAIGEIEKRHGVSA